MLDALLGWVKGLFGSKGVLQAGSANRAISGVTAGDNAGGIVVGDGNVVNFGNTSKEPEQPQPIVRIDLALTNHPTRGFVHFLCITILNTTGKSIFIGNFLLEVNDNQNLFVPFDSISGETQKKRDVRAGDSFAFRIEARRFHEIGCQQRYESVTKARNGPGQSASGRSQDWRIS